MTALSEALNRYNTITRNLASLYKQRGILRAEEIATKRDAFINGPADSVTARRENASVAAAEWGIELAKLQGDIEANEVELRYLDQHIAGLKLIEGTDG